MTRGGALQASGSLCEWQRAPLTGWGAVTPDDAQAEVRGGGGSSGSSGGGGGGFRRQENSRRFGSFGGSGSGGVGGCGGGGGGGGGGSGTPGRQQQMRSPFGTSGGPAGRPGRTPDLRPQSAPGSVLSGSSGSQYSFRSQRAGAGSAGGTTDRGRASSLAPSAQSQTVGRGAVTMAGGSTFRPLSSANRAQYASKGGWMPGGLPKG